MKVALKPFMTLAEFRTPALEAGPSEMPAESLACIKDDDGGADRNICIREVIEPGDEPRTLLNADHLAQVAAS